MMIQCIAVDDEPLALGLVCRFIEQAPFLQLAGRFASAVDALKTIHQQPVDLIFLDIQMSDLNGIELARIINKWARPPQVIFTTAYEKFALEGYKLDARDYLLKPFDYEEFLRAATRAHDYIELLHSNRAGDPTMPEKATENYLFLKVAYQLVRIALEDIIYIEGVKDYVKVHLRSTDKPVLSLTSLKALEEKLPPQQFLRLHRSYIVALDKISSMTKNTVHTGKLVITVGEQYRTAFNKFAGKWG